MRHKKSFNHLGRKSAHRKAMLSNMASSLIIHKRISTTTAKAKALRMYIEPLITKSKDDTTHSRRVVFSYLKDKDAVSELFREVSAKIANRPGGYTRILKTGTRLGDNADMCVIELVDYNENLLEAKESSKSEGGKRRRRRRGSGSGSTDQAQPKKEATSGPEDAVVVEEEKKDDTAPETEEVKDQAIEAKADQPANDENPSAEEPKTNDSEETEKKED